MSDRIEYYNALYDLGVRQKQRKMKLYESEITLAVTVWAESEKDAEKRIAPYLPIECGEELEQTTVEVDPSEIACYAVGALNPQDDPREDCPPMTKMTSPERKAREVIRDWWFPATVVAVLAIPWAVILWQLLVGLK